MPIVEVPRGNVVQRLRDRLAASTDKRSEIERAVDELRTQLAKEQEALTAKAQVVVALQNRERLAQQEVAGLREELEVLAGLAYLSEDAADPKREDQLRRDILRAESGLAILARRIGLAATEVNAARVDILPTQNALTAAEQVAQNLREAAEHEPATVFLGGFR